MADSRPATSSPRYAMLQGIRLLPVTDVGHFIMIDDSAIFDPLLRPRSR